MGTRDAETTSRGRGSGRPRRRRHRLRWVLLVLAVLLLALGALTAWQALTAYRHLRAVEDLAPSVREQVRAGDEEGLRQSVATLQRDTAAAREAVDGPQWTVLGTLPWIGADFHAVQAVGLASDELATGALADLVRVSQRVTLADLEPVDGRFDTAPLREAHPDLVAAARSARAADERLADVDTARVWGRIRGKVERAAEEVAALRSATDTAARASGLLPEVLGADGPRNYLLLVQNNAEPRALGGIAGSMIRLHTDRGRVQLAETRPGSSFPELARPVLPLTAGESSLYSTQLGRFAQNATGTPDFPRAAQIASASWGAREKTRIDGVASIDPVGLGQLLKVTGPVRMPNGLELTEQNAARVLMNQVYVDLPDPAAQDAFFGLAAGRIFSRATSGPLDVRAAMDVLGEMAREGRFLFWSADAEQERQVAGSTVAGELRGAVGDSPEIGVFLHDRTQAKVAYYEDMDITVRPKVCTDDGPRKYTVTVTLASHVPADVRKLGTQTGLGAVVPVGQLSSQVFLYAPEGGQVTAFRVSRGGTEITRARHDGLDVVSKQVVLKPGETVTLEYDVQAPERLSGPVLLRSTPGPEIGRFGVTTTPCTP